MKEKKKNNTNRNGTVPQYVINREGYRTYASIFWLLAIDAKLRLVVITKTVLVRYCTFAVSSDTKIMKVPETYADELVRTSVYIR